MTEPDALFRHFIPIRDLANQPKGERTAEATAAERAAIADAFGLVDLSRFDVAYSLRPSGEDGWRLDGRINAKIAQNCVVTLNPVVAKVTETFTRVYEPGAADPFAAPGDLDIDLDLDADDPPEPLGEGIDVGAAALETLSLAIDPYPRSKGADFEGASARPEGAEPLTDEARKPFAALAALRKAMDEKG